MSILTHEILSTCDDATLKALAKSDAHKAVVLNFLAMRETLANAEAVSMYETYTNGGLFTLNGQEVPFWIVAFTALSKMSLNKDNAYNNVEQFPELARITSEAWDTLKLIQRGAKVAGVEFKLDSESLRALTNSLV